MLLVPQAECHLVFYFYFIGETFLDISSKSQHQNNLYGKTAPRGRGKIYILYLEVNCPFNIQSMNALQTNLIMHFEMSVRLLTNK